MDPLDTTTSFEMKSVVGTSSNVVLKIVHVDESLVSTSVHLATDDTESFLKHIIAVQRFNISSRFSRPLRCFRNVRERDETVPQSRYIPASSNNSSHFSQHIKIFEASQFES